MLISSSWEAYIGVCRGMMWHTKKEKDLPHGSEIQMSLAALKNVCSCLKGSAALVPEVLHGQVLVFQLLIFWGFPCAGLSHFTVVSCGCSCFDSSTGQHCFAVILSLTLRR